MAERSPTELDLIEALQRGDRRALAKAITLVESDRADHRRIAESLIEHVLPRTGGSIRLGISGAPGVGKSTFIEAFGLNLITRGHRVAVLAVDPSSRRTGGSILGDKTRMEQLSRSPAAFIRPSPAGSTPGGVARRTREVLLVCEAAGYDVVLVETVGVGQAELAVADMTDLFLLLVSPGGGDELQGIKRGIMELADYVVITKADGELASSARGALGDHKRALQLLRPPHRGLTPRALVTSSLTGSGIDEMSAQVEADYATLARTGELARARSAQLRAWLWYEITEGIRATLRDDPDLARLLDAQEEKVAVNATSPVSAARRLVAELRKKSGLEP